MPKSEKHLKLLEEFVRDIITKSKIKFEAIEHIEIESNKIGGVLIKGIISSDLSTLMKELKEKGKEVGLRVGIVEEGTPSKTECRLVVSLDHPDKIFKFNAQQVASAHQEAKSGYSDIADKLASVAAAPAQPAPAQQQPAAQQSAAAAQPPRRLPAQSDEPYPEFKPEHLIKQESFIKAVFGRLGYKPQPHLQQINEEDQKGFLISGFTTKEEAEVLERDYFHFSKPGHARIYGDSIEQIGDKWGVRFLLPNNQPQKYMWAIDEVLSKPERADPNDYRDALDMLRKSRRRAGAEVPQRHATVASSAPPVESKYGAPPKAQPVAQQLPGAASTQAAATAQPPRRLPVQSDVPYPEFKPEHLEKQKNFIRNVLGQFGYKDSDYELQQIDQEDQKGFLISGLSQEQAHTLENFYFHFTMPGHARISGEGIKPMGDKWSVEFFLPSHNPQKYDWAVNTALNNPNVKLKDYLFLLEWKRDLLAKQRAAVAVPESKYGPPTNAAEGQFVAPSPAAQQPAVENQTAPKPLVAPPGAAAVQAAAQPPAAAIPRQRESKHASLEASREVEQPLVQPPSAAAQRPAAAVSSAGQNQAAQLPQVSSQQNAVAARAEAEKNAEQLKQKLKEILVGIPVTIDKIIIGSDLNFLIKFSSKDPESKAILKILRELLQRNQLLYCNKVTERDSFLAHLFSGNLSYNIQEAINKLSDPKIVEPLKVALETDIKVARQSQQVSPGAQLAAQSPAAAAQQQPVGAASAAPNPAAPKSVVAPASQQRAAGRSEAEKSAEMLKQTLEEILEGISVGMGVSNSQRGASIMFISTNVEILKKIKAFFQSYNLFPCEAEVYDLPVASNESFFNSCSLSNEEIQSAIKKISASVDTWKAALQVELEDVADAQQRPPAPPPLRPR